MEILANFPLRTYTTFGVKVRARRFASVQTVTDLQALFRTFSGESYVLLGGGSNLLLTQDIDGLVVHNRILGKSVVERQGHQVLVKAGAGEDWHSFVNWSLDQGLNGLENLSLIPGTVGAAPIQNIGAYGQEQANVFSHLEAVEVDTGQVCIFNHQDCAFGYRDSVFKKKWKGRYVITQVFFSLSSDPSYQADISYGAIQAVLEEKGIEKPDARQVSEAVIDIRRSKLPDPKVLGNAGSFFKNPVVPAEQFQALQKIYPQIPYYPQDEYYIKLPAAWLIDQCGWKGKRVGATGCYAKQALVIVNYGKASGKEIWAFAQQVMQSVKDRFGVELEPEVNVV